MQFHVPSQEVLVQLFGLGDFVGKVVYDEAVRDGLPVDLDSSYGQSASTQAN